MNSFLDLDQFTTILSEKGYDNYFHTQASYPGKLRDSISDFLQSCRKGTDKLPGEDMLLNCYLQWSGEDKPRVECTMWVNYANNKFSLKRMEVIKTDGFGRLLRKSDLTNLSVFSVPNTMEAIALVNDGQEQNAGISRHVFGR